MGEASRPERVGGFDIHKVVAQQTAGGGGHDGDLRFMTGVTPRLASGVLSSTKKR